jgi:hypothetical protein
LASLAGAARRNRPIGWRPVSPAKTHLRGESALTAMPGGFISNAAFNMVESR